MKPVVGNRCSTDIDNLVTRKVGSCVPDSNYCILNVTSRSSNHIARALSPFLLGKDGMDAYNGMTAYCVENVWQYSKVYSGMADSNGEPNDEYWKWMTEGFRKMRAVRYPMGKGAKPLYSLWNGEKYGYIEARKNIYAYLYAKEAFKSEQYKVIKQVFDMGRKICIYDFDAYNREERRMTLRDVIEYPNMKCGHGFILEMMLRGIIEIDEANGKIIFDWSKDF